MMGLPEIRSDMAQIRIFKKSGIRERLFIAFKLATICFSTITFDVQSTNI